jgi:alpha-tubulin suppressor-like RCC1 family protein
LISSGRHILIYKNNGDLYVTGSNTYGQLGLGDDIERFNLTFLHNDSDIKSIHCGGYHTLIYKNTGDLYVFGMNQYGQLGLGNYNFSINVPVLLMNDNNIKSIHVGEFRTILYKNNGDIFMFGECTNIAGTTGLITPHTINVPTLILNDINIKSINIIGNAILLYKANGDLFGWGCNRSNQLNLGKENSIMIPTFIMNDKDIKIISGYHSYILLYKNNGDLLRFGSTNYVKVKPSLILNDNNINAISCNFITIFIYKYNRELCIYSADMDIKLQSIKDISTIININDINNIKVPKYVIYEINKFICQY